MIINPKIIYYINHMNGIFNIPNQRYVTYINPMILNDFYNWLLGNNLNANKQLIDQTSNEHWLILDNKYIGRFGPIITISPYVNLTARLSIKDNINLLYKQYYDINLGS